jgi:ATP-dependent Lhr-like helicase
VFPDQVACAENLSGELEIPDHPLVNQAIRDCLEEAMDVAGLERLLRGIEAGSICTLARDLTEPSPLALEVLSARPYAFLDDAPLEERRTQAVMSRRWLDPASAADIGKLDPEAIARVRAEAWPDALNADELHDALMWLTFLTAAEVERQEGWPSLMATLAAERRATELSASGARLWVTAEQLPLFAPLYPDASRQPQVTTPAAHARELTAESALIEVVRGRLTGSGPVTVPGLAALTGIAPGRIEAALAALEAEGFAMRGLFTPEGAAGTLEWCERRLLARIHRYTVKRLRAEIEPIEARDFLRFLFEWQRVTAAARMEGPDAVGAILAQLEGFEAAAGAWETEILPERISEYEPAWLDEQCLAGRFLWTRLSSRRSDPERRAAPVRATPIVLLARRNQRLWSALGGMASSTPLGAAAERVAHHLTTHGASFFDELTGGTGLLPSQAEEALAELVALGLVNSDSFAGLRALLVPSDRRRPAMGGRRRRRIALFGMEAGGGGAPPPRDAVVPPAFSGGRAATAAERAREEELVEHVVRTLLKRWGVVFWRLLAREADWLPPWRELLMCCRRLEARGEIRGGRFVAGVSGEQYAAPEAIGLLREARRKPREGHYVSLSGSDPLNLVGILTPGARVPAIAGNRVLYRDGVPVAVLAGGEVEFLTELPPAEQWEARNKLVRRHVPAVLADLA